MTESESSARQRRWTIFTKLWISENAAAAALRHRLGVLMDISRVTRTGSRAADALRLSVGLARRAVHPPHFP